MAKRRKKETSAKKADKITLPPIFAMEREQISVRRKMELPLSVDEHGRDRLPSDTAESHRRYDRSSTGIFRLRLADPLKEIRGLSPRQRNAGGKYREDYEAANAGAIKPASFDVKVDISGTPKGIPDHRLDAQTALREARACLTHETIANVVDLVCGQRMSIREVAQAEGQMTPRPALAVLLSIGLDYLAKHYYGPAPRKRV